MYVGKSTRLYCIITKNINKLFEARLEKAEHWLNYDMGEEQLGRIVLDSVIPPDHQKIFQVLGDLYFKQTSRLFVRIYNDVYEFSIPTCYLPHKRTTEFPCANLITDGPVLEIANRRKAAINSIRQEQSAFLEAFDKAWGAVPSVNALLKIWPAVEHLLPDSAIQTINKKSKRMNKTRIAEEIDVSGLSTQLLKAKIQA